MGNSNSNPDPDPPQPQPTPFLTTPVWSGHLMLIIAVNVAGGGDAVSPASSTIGGWFCFPVVPPLVSAPAAGALPSPGLVGVGVTRSLIWACAYSGSGWCMSESVSLLGRVRIHGHLCKRCVCIICCRMPSRAAVDAATLHLTGRSERAKAWVHRPFFLQNNIYHAHDGQCHAANNNIIAHHVGEL